MSGVVEKRLAELGVVVPKAVAPAANYVPFRRSGNTVYVSGQIPKCEDGTLLTGKLGANYSLEEGQKAAKQCALNIVGQVKEACEGDLDRVQAVVQVQAFVNCTDDFTQHPQVVNGASDFLVAVFGSEVGAHSRFAVGCSSLPLGVAVEVGAVVELRPAQ
mmetsp:Transcript_3416/g.9795  ORF Transcript_3416/g.9795 Transcript_3416/m.9795 type:complete len:160 (+) Transcript_3416:83-562(+)